MTADDALQHLQIRETIERYFFAVDAKDLKTLESCFSDNAEADYHVTTPELNTVRGGKKIADSVYAVCSQFTASSHSVCNFVAELHGETAAANTFAIAHVILGTRALVRGIRYQDQLIRTPNRWLISHRIHTPQWQYEANAVTPKLA